MKIKFYIFYLFVAYFSFIKFYLFNNQTYTVAKLKFLIIIINFLLKQFNFKLILLFQ